MCNKEEQQSKELDKQWRKNLYNAFRQWTEESIKDLQEAKTLKEKLC